MILVHMVPDYTLGTGSASLWLFLGQFSSILVGHREKIRGLENFLKDGGSDKPHP